ncbi:MAG TPA: hypothetical protein VEO75_03775 [Nitrososphaerales archaeon]|nr:hypothetical protein [Nitrososphaerales archaeon]
MLLAFTRTKVALAMGLLIALNLVTFLSAYPSISNLETACCASGQFAARDFSAYYVGLWRLLHDPTQVYTHGFVADGEIHVFPTQEQYKYLPSFLLMTSPLLPLGYQQAIVVFDVFQFLLLLPIGLLIYLLVKHKGSAATIAVGVVVLLAPAPAPGWALSVPYFWLWKEGQAKVLETFMLLLSFYLGKRGLPYPSGLVFGLSCFDPRFGLIALPVFIMYNRTRISPSGVALISTLAVSNAPLIIFPQMGAGFLQMVFTTGIPTVFYPYALIPLFAVASLWLLNRKEMASAWRL